MKKTLIASAVAAVVAAPAAFADVTIKGQINQEFYDAGGDMQSDLNSDIVFSGKEDLGNGLTANWKIHTFLDNGSYGSNGAGDTCSASQATSTVTSSVTQATSLTVTSVSNTVSNGAVTNTCTEKNVTADQIIGLSGDFGSIQVGRFEPLTEGAMAAMANIDASDALDLEHGLGNQTRTEGGIRYTSPSFNGLKVAVEGFADESVTGEDLTTTTIYAQYSNAGLTVKAAQENNEGGSDFTSIGVAYKLDGLELRVLNTEKSTAGSADVDNTFFGASYTMGNNAVAVGMIDADGAEDGDSIVSFKHSMSKSTSVYLTHLNDDSASDNTTLIGLQHKF